MWPIYECPKSFWESLRLTMPMAIFPKYLMGFTSDGCYEYAYKI